MTHQILSAEQTMDLMHSQLESQARELELLRRQVTSLQTSRSIAVEYYRSADLYVQVREFRAMTGLPIASRIGEISTARLHANLKLKAEEFCEVLEACGAPKTLADWLYGAALAIITGECNPGLLDFTKLADGLADEDYINEGFRQETGIPGKSVALAVHRANMAKRGGTITEAGKFTKPAGWQPPDAEIARVLRDHGWNDRGSAERLDQELSKLEGTGVA